MRDQHPVTPPRYRFRIRGDSYTVPVGREAPHPIRAEPFDGGSWDHETDPEPLSLADLTASNVVGGVLMFLAVALVIVVAFVMGPA